MQIKKDNQLRRRRRIRAKVFGTHERPRLSVFRSDKHILAQLIDDESGKTLVAVTDKQVAKTAKTKKEKSFLVGKLLAEKAVAKKIKQAVFDRGGYIYHGRVKELAEGARQGGLEF
ncbi:MAG: 50S ribosomal protein L18 [Parcubacteria group bacterium GW2011_GWC1_45_9]|nr:MAG: 50S ribosomal protein L18 [Parcubacteria group bacterium GW2011_GWA1_Parcubacteria_45_10]KKT88476.1 MAG: 50S ribosomal protein L18 [Parcubacteria group bacterium GW2011_GWB1_45_10]KKU17312.1 MAG: 50S ribosomal protein L18 [Parcubacteria group bacterium GW2011_GWC1_45_9]HCI05206.1 50S ribosomal protein L18 [Patescibacteria group bacterium]